MSAGASSVQGDSSNSSRKFTPVHVPLSFVVGLTLFHVSFIAAFGWLLAALFGNPAVVPWHLAFTSLYVCEVLALLTHWVGHRRIEWFPFSKWYEAHTTGHHVNDYPGEWGGVVLRRVSSLSSQRTSS